MSIITTSNPPLATVELGQHVRLSVYLLVNPSCNFQTLGQFIKFESKENLNQHSLISSVWRATSIQNSIFNGITSVFLFHFYPVDSTVTKFQITITPENPNKVDFMKISQETSQGPIKLDINELSKHKHFFTTFKFLSRFEKNPHINLSWEYTCEQKTTSSTSTSFSLSVSPPFFCDLKIAKVRNEGVLLEVTLCNMSKYIARNVRLEVIPSNSYVVDESELLISDFLLPLSRVSSVYPLELQRGEGTFSTKILESLTVKWSTGFEENCSMPLDISQLEEQTKPRYPVAISMIGSPQTQKLLTPFSVKFDIHNTTAEERVFAINVDAKKETGLLPYGIHVFTTELLPAKGSQRIVMEFIALKQGLLPYPELIISTANFNEFRIDPENGVLILADLSEPT